jgi:hypothetical protein
MRKLKEKKHRPPVKLDPQPGWNLGLWVPITIAHGKPIPAFLKTMILKSQ